MEKGTTTGIITDIRYLKKLFPPLRNKVDYHKLQIDAESASYISTKYVAKQISQIIIFHLEKLYLSPKTLAITDTCAGAGGNTLSFSRYFKQVFSIEMDDKRFGYLDNNISLYQKNNILPIHGDCLNIIPNLAQNVVFFDPPWGGKDYKKQSNIRLELSGIPLEAIIDRLIHDPLSSPELIIVKVPKNFDTHHFYNWLKSNRIYLYQLAKMDILVIENTGKIGENLQKLL